MLDVERLPDYRFLGTLFVIPMIVVAVYLFVANSLFGGDISGFLSEAVLGLMGLFALTLVILPYLRYDKRPLDWFRRFSRRSLIYTLIFSIISPIVASGIGIGIHYGSPTTPREITNLIQLLAGGGIFFWALFATGNIAAPIIAHGTYNFLGPYIAFIILPPIIQLFIPFYFPTLPNELNYLISYPGITEGLRHFLLIAPTEELLKLSFALGVSMLFGFGIKYPFLVAIFIWALLHFEPFQLPSYF